MANRPLGVTVICVLGWIGAIFTILAGLALLGVAAVGGTVLSTTLGMLAGYGVVLGALFVVLGIANLVVLYWLWQMKKQGWKWTMILEIISLVMSLVQISIVGIAIPAIVVIYLWMNKKLFK